MGHPWYATREDVLHALDLAESTRAGAQLDRLIDAASRSVEEPLTHRRFYPERSVKTFRWPDRQMGTSYRLWLDASPLLSVETIVSNGVELTEYFLEPQSYGPPYSHIELDLATGTGAFGGGLTPQRSITITGTWGSCGDTTSGSTLEAALTGGSALLEAADGAHIGVGSLLLVDAEYMQVTGRMMLTTGAAISADLVANRADNVIEVTDPSTFVAGETIRIDAERLYIVEVVGATIIVERAVESSILTEHDLGSTVYASRGYMVERGQLGTTATSHTVGTAVLRHAPPADVASLVIEEVLWSLQNEQAAMARTIGQGDNARQVSISSITDRRTKVEQAYARMRKRAV